MNEQQKRDMVMDALDAQILNCGGHALIRATGKESDWAATPPQNLPIGQARMLAALQKFAGNEHSSAVLDKTWMEGEREAAIQFVNHVFDEFTLWAMTSRPDLMKTCRELINEALPPEERI